MKKLLIIDGNSIINRAFYAIKALANKQGMFTNGIYGFLNILFKHTEEPSATKNMTNIRHSERGCPKSFVCRCLL